MEIYGEISKVRAAVKAWKKDGLTVGFVPTMGYLHEGHKSLIDAARKENDRVVVSIFVNPMQFGPTEDLESYPRDLKKDAALCEAAGVDIIFHPEPEEMYADGFCSYVDIFTDYESNKLALGMLADGPLETFLREHPQVTSIRFCLDRDEPGRKAAAELMRKYYER